MSRRGRLLVASVAGLGVLLAPAAARAHPLGNFTINTSAGIVVHPDEVAVGYVVDMAEIPTFRERQRIDGDADGAVSAEEADAYRGTACARLADGISVAVDGAAVGLVTRSSTLAFPAGQAGLRTMRLTCLLSADVRGASAHQITLEDGNFLGRIGWHEVTATGDRATLTRSDVPAESPSDRLRAYPKGVLPLAVRSASIAFRPGGPALRAGADAPAATAPAAGGLLAGFAARPQLSMGLVVVMIAIAFGVGALHALGPGHGKALIGAYLVGGDGTVRQAVAVGGAVSVMHTASVLGLGLLVLSTERILPPERVYPWLGLSSGLVALGLGAGLLVSRLHELSARRRHGHDHIHQPRPLSRRGLVALAFSGGILPSPSALVVLLGSVSLGRTALGLALIAAFSVGLAASLVSVGALAVRARYLATGRLPARLMRLAPIVSASCIVVLGVALTARGLIGI